MSSDQASRIDSCVADYTDPLTRSARARRDAHGKDERRREAWKRWTFKENRGPLDIEVVRECFHNAIDSANSAFLVLKIHRIDRLATCLFPFAVATHLRVARLKQLEAKSER